MRISRRSHLQSSRLPTLVQGSRHAETKELQRTKPRAAPRQQALARLLGPCDTRALVHGIFFGFAACHMLSGSAAGHVHRTHLLR